MNEFDVLNKIEETQGKKDLIYLGGIKKELVQFRLINFRYER